LIVLNGSKRAGWLGKPAAGHAANDFAIFTIKFRNIRLELMLVKLVVLNGSKRASWL
ncbi:9489_t:CDS:1, partial [Funneliformis caledonium]